MPKIRVMVVDDAVVMRKMITDVLNRDPQLEVVGVAANGKIALQRIPQINPDLVTLDVEMPEMNGIETLKQIRKLYPRLPVIMFSTLTERGAATTLDALTFGASDYVTKPANIGSITEGISRLASELIPKIKTHCRHIRFAEGPGEHTLFLSKVQKVQVPIRAPLKKACEIVCIGTSTGGPNALAALFNGFVAPTHVPIVIVQHMPPMFTALLAERLNSLGSVAFSEGKEGEPIQAGHAYIAPGGKHMVLRKEGGRIVIRTNMDPPENSCRPAVDVLFKSVAELYGSSSVGVVLTGMGQDGLRGCQHLRESGAQVVVQDEASSVVWGMPGCVAQAGLADAILPLHQVWGEVQRRIKNPGSSIPSQKIA